ncbi:hypothetical protein TVAG_390420 [Trichomonas vaginalis G3]|uniref:SMP-LTD domain-containing protein n=1 Tax=Trichomonas vaginalis (strain ATCC PRA-98 / G3) TaxID=412133 RepID=A2ESU6_TRIV3|nr:hypothetical protein TVAGG3_0182040 [Trichomonas vaginalis G3]EAY04272.1 hypothetical protein TVAG_390420 [Trichomonas vaginalis G3]KAI5549365.1 hypothetical protein TVAGG3_0182040 [Trichomonas vaginalis G3]|eukprot:XP_001316495.1 hypothetical protein [Trichomonas vaginalis G3]
MGELYGVGKILQFIEDNFFLSRATLFVFACVVASWGYNCIFFVFIFLELFIYFCQYIGPVIDKNRKEEFDTWVDQSLKVTGGETAHCLNGFIEQAWQPIFPDTYSPFFCQLLTDLFTSLLPKIIRNINFTWFSFGKRPPKIIQVVTEQAPNPMSVALTASVVYAQDLSIKMNCTVLKIPFTLELTDLVAYAPLQVTVETPEKPNFLYLPPITAIVFNSPQHLRILSNTLKLNGYNVGKLPLINFLWCHMLEHFFKLILSDGESVVWNFVTGEWKLRHMTRPYSSLSAKMFQGIATESTPTKLGRFSMPESMLAAFNDTRKKLWERLYAEKIPPTKRLVYLAPNHGEMTQLLLPYENKTAEKADIETQTEIVENEPEKTEN